MERIGLTTIGIPTVTLSVAKQPLIGWGTESGGGGGGYPGLGYPRWKLLSAEEGVELSFKVEDGFYMAVTANLYGVTDEGEEVLMAEGEMFEGVLSSQTNRLTADIYPEIMEEGMHYRIKVLSVIVFDINDEVIVDWWAEDDNDMVKDVEFGPSPVVAEYLMLNDGSFLMLNNGEYLEINN